MQTQDLGEIGDCKIDELSITMRSETVRQHLNLSALEAKACLLGVA